jgi:nitrile hydratase
VPNTHDLGGKREFFGPIAHTPDEPPFHAEWERRVFGTTNFLHTLLGPNIDEFRGHLALLPPEEYFGPYYRRWIAGVERMFAGYLSGTQTVSPLKVAATSRVVRSVITRPRLPQVMNSSVMPRVIGTAKKARRPAVFTVGDAVRVRAASPAGHTQQPDYVSGKRGCITEHRGAALFPDARVATGSTTAEHLYTVVFDSAELWGEAAEPNTEIRIELFEP